MLGLHAVFSGCWNKFSTWNILDCHLLYNAGFGKALIEHFLPIFTDSLFLKTSKVGDVLYVSISVIVDVTLDHIRRVNFRSKSSFTRKLKIYLPSLK